MIQVYAIRCTRTGLSYVGSGQSANSRWADHKRKLTKGVQHNPRLQHAWNKYGEARFKLIILDQCVENDRNVCEQMWIDKLGKYNLRPADRNTGTFSASTKKTMSASAKKRHAEGRNKNLLTRGNFPATGARLEALKKGREEVRRRQAEGSFKGGMVGRHHTEESKRQMSLNMKGRRQGVPQSPDHVRKRVEARRITLELRQHQIS